MLFRSSVYTSERPDAFGVELEKFLDREGLRDKRVLEVGSGRGYFQDCVRDYTGVDIAEDLRKFYRDPSRFVVVQDGEPLPFATNSFDGAFTYAVFEHIPSLENAFRELLRVVKPGGAVFFDVAWQVRPWAARGLSVRPYRDLGLRDKLEKLTVPLRNSVAWRLAFITPSRLWRTLRFQIGRAHV